LLPERCRCAMLRRRGDDRPGEIDHRGDRASLMPAGLQLEGRVVRTWRLLMKFTASFEQKPIASCHTLVCHSMRDRRGGLQLGLTSKSISDKVSNGCNRNVDHLQDCAAALEKIRRLKSAPENKKASRFLVRP
jgi:hypothetical protein